MREAIVMLQLEKHLINLNLNLHFAVLFNALALALLDALDRTCVLVDGGGLMSSKTTAQSSIICSELGGCGSACAEIKKKCDLPVA